MDTIFAKYTKKIINALPFWFKIKKYPNNSIGAHFLNVTGIELDELEYILNYAYDQTNISRSDTSYLDIVYKSSLPTYVSTSDTLYIHSNTSVDLIQQYSVEDFYIVSSDNMINPELHYDDPFYIDYNTQTIYVKKNYEELYVSVNSGDDIEIKLSLHNVWNFFDEFGLLVSIPRIYGEDNLSYKSRLLDVFKNRHNTSIEGLFNGISRELNLRKEVYIPDRRDAITIKDPMVVLNEIKRDGEFIDLEQIFITSDNYVYIPGVDEQGIISSTISYVSGIEMHTLHNQKDYQLRNRLFNIDGTGTNLLKYYANLIKSEVPIMWGHWKWNEGYWDVIDDDLDSNGFIPNIIDSSVSGFIGVKRGGN